MKVPNIFLTLLCSGLPTLMLGAEAKSTSLTTVTPTEAQWIQQAQQSCTSGNLVLAEKELLHHIQPDSALALWATLAKIQWDLKKYEAVETSLLHIVERAPEHSDTRRQLVQLYLLIEKYDEALEQCQQLIQQEPKADVYLNMAQIYVIQNNDLNAEFAYRQAYFLDPQGQASSMGLAQTLLRQKRWLECISLCRARLMHSPQEAVYWRVLVHALRQQGFKDEALQECALAQKYCDDHDLNHLATELYLEAGLLYSARENLSQLSNQLDASTALRWGLQFLQGEDLLTTQQCLNIAEKQNLNSSKDFEICFFKARIAEQSGKLQDAITLYRQALQQSPLDGSCLLHLAKLLSSTAREEAILLLQRATSLPAFSRQAWLILAETYVQQQDWKKALQAAEKALALQADPAIAKFCESIRQQMH